MQVRMFFFVCRCRRKDKRGIYPWCVCSKEPCFRLLEKSNRVTFSMPSSQSVSFLLNFHLVGSNSGIASICRLATGDFGVLPKWPKPEGAAESCQRLVHKEPVRHSLR